MKVRISIIASGRVQGVAYRNCTQREAVNLGVNGWVRNMPDGTVEGCFEGEEGAVKDLVNWCRRGPSAAVVERLDLMEGTFTGEFESFQIKL